MSKFIIAIYYWFREHRTAFWLSMLMSFALFAVMASRMKIEEDISAFFPKSEGTRTMTEVFSNLRISDRLIVLFSPEQGCEGDECLFEASDRLGEMLESREGLVRDYVSGISSEGVSGILSYVQEHLPSFMDDEDFRRLDMLESQEYIDSLIYGCYLGLISPAGFAMKDYIMSDPLSTGAGVMGRLQELNPSSDYVVRDGHIFSPDGEAMLAFIDPAFHSGETGRNDLLVSHIENCLDSLACEFPQVRTHYFGGPAVGVYNARQIKKDTYTTSIVALIIIVLFILAVFKRRRSVFLILCPVIYGAVFAIAAASLFQSSISGIAIGAGAAIMGVALSYSIHMLAHQNHVRDVPQLLEEICSPLVIGSITTIGAFIGLLFTSSRLLSDFGLFASFTLVGTMLFCLLFLPQFLVGSGDLREGRILSFIEKFSSYPFEKNRALVAGLVVLAVVCCFTSQRVGFNSDMMSLNYWEPHLKESEEILTSQTDKAFKTVMFVTTGRDADEVYANYIVTEHLLDSLEKAGKVQSTDNACPFLVGKAESEARTARWREWWTPERTAKVKEMTRSAAAKAGFREDAFDDAVDRLANGTSAVDLFGESSLPDAFSAWVAETDNLKMFVSRATLSRTDIPDVYQVFAGRDEVVVFDQAYFTDQAARTVNDDFYLILYISSFLIFFVLWLSYGRLELALLSFLPMFVSWIIIIGLMGIIGMQFNIVNIILSTFIFGMGDDFSIFILEGLLYRYRTGKTLLDPHKTAIFFSSFTMIVGIGALIFARHPALHSIAVITILGMLAVVLVAYVLEPLIFNSFITRPASSGKPPYTFRSILRDIIYYVPVFIGGILLLLLSLILMAVPVKHSRRQAIVAGGMHYCCRLLLWMMPFIRSRRYGPDRLPVRAWHGEPGIIVANHQSSIDIFVIAAMFPKIKFMVADWVMSSPLFSIIARYLGYYTKSEGYDNIAARFSEDIAEGWSLVIFPEGTRSADGHIRRFHKGAFRLASQAGTKLIPVVMYGNRRIMPKNEGFNMAEGLAVAEILSPVKAEGIDYHVLVKEVERSVRIRYSELCRKYDSPENPYFREALESCYIYKGPVTEWYAKRRIRQGEDYAVFDSMIPDDAVVTDIGCGMGQLAYMLSMYRPGRRVTGIDYDSSKIAVASNCWPIHNLPNLRFICDDAVSSVLPESDVFILNGILHYLGEEEQASLLGKCALRLRPGGMLIVRESEKCDDGRLRGYASALGMEVEPAGKALHAANVVYRLTIRKED
ncbi:MAG: 1-acyl-sn-glycerol-3-phosphate acyltransferase [Candidatus Cryptobacteroides sp.]